MLLSIIFFTVLLAAAIGLVIFVICIIKEILSYDQSGIQNLYNTKAWQ
jgi:DMSO reductase anchor subunit